MYMVAPTGPVDLVVLIGLVDLMGLAISSPTWTTLRILSSRFPASPGLRLKPQRHLWLTPPRPPTRATPAALVVAAAFLRPAPAPPIPTTGVYQGEAAAAEGAQRVPQSRRRRRHRRIRRHLQRRWEAPPLDISLDPETRTSGGRTILRAMKLWDTIIEARGRLPY